MRHARFIPIVSATIATITTLSLIAGSAAALMPSDSVYGYMKEKYSLELQADRTSCGYSIDPNDVKISGDRRATTVTVTSSNRGGTGCYGVRYFMLMDVNCDKQTGRFLQLKGFGRSAQWQGMEMNKDAVNIVCQLPN
jgi:hypothetical protein